MDHTLVNEDIRWGTIVVTYMFLSGIGAGTLIVAVLPRLPWLFDEAMFVRLRRYAIITAAACFTVIPLAVIADLGQPHRMWRVLLAPHAPSAMPYGSVLLIALTLLIFVNLWLLHRPSFAWVAQECTGGWSRICRFFAAGASPDDPPAGKGGGRSVLLIVSVAVAVAFVAYTGFLLSTMVSFGLWYSQLLGVVFALAAIASGFIWLTLVMSALGSRAGSSRLLRLLAGTAATFLLAHTAVRLWDLGHASYVRTMYWPAVRELLFDRFAFSYIGLELVLGGAVASTLLILAAARGARSAAIAGSALGLVALYASRWNIIIGGQSISRTGHGFVEYHPHLFGREGLIPAIGLVLWSLVIGYVLVRILPWRERVATPRPGGNSTPADTRGLVDISRRQAVILGSGVALALVAGFENVRALLIPRYRKHQPGPTPLAADRVVHSICLSCDARCGNRLIVRDGVIRTAFGNPYHPASTCNQPVPLTMPVKDSLRHSGSLCLKGVSGLQYLYDPYRLRRPLKRTGPRGSGQFKPIPWSQLIEEIVEGGNLFAEIGEDRHVDGLRQIRSFEPVDSKQPELGPKAYQLAWNTGRGQDGRQDFIQRFLEAFGSTNYVSHTDLCQMNWYVTNYLFTGRYYPGNDKTVSQLFGDIVNSKFMIFFGVNLGGGWKPGVNTSAPILANRHARGDGKLVLVDPYVPHGRHYADEWVAPKPGTDAAMVMGMIRWILDHDRFDRQYLENTSIHAAEADDEPTWTNSSFLVVWHEEDERHRRFLRARDMGMGDNEYIVVDRDSGELATSADSAAGELFVDRTVTDAEGRQIRVKSSLQILRDEAHTRTIDQWAEICEVPAETITRLAREFTSHGKQATASCYRGATMRSYGMYAGWAIQALNALIGNHGWKGGVIRDATGPGWKSGMFDVQAVEDAPEVKGVHISRISARSDSSYQQSTEYKRKLEAGEDPYPSTRPWYPLTHAGITTEALAAADTGYPYRVKCYINYYINSVHSIPGGERFIETLKDPNKIPLFISVDTQVSETSVYSDYIIPDCMYLDGQFGFMPQQAGACSAAHMAIRTPAVEPLTERTSDGRPMIMETFLIDVAERLGMPGYGERGIVGQDEFAGQHFPLHRAEDYYMRAIGNLAANAGTPPADDEELAWVERNYPVAQHKEILPVDLWRRAAYLLARGGYFESPDQAWDEKGRQKRRFGLHPDVPLQIWHEIVATTRETMTGKLLPGGPTYHPAEDGTGRRLSEIDRDYPFQLITFRLATRTKARTAYDYWAIETHPINYIEINRDDAARRGIADGDRVRVYSPSGSAEGFVKLSHRVRPGVIAGTHHFGHTQQGNSRLEIEDAATVMLGTTQMSPVMHGLNQPIAVENEVRPDTKRASRGFNVNNAMRRNDALDQTPLVDNAGGATVFLDSRVNIERVASA